MKKIIILFLISTIGISLKGQNTTMANNCVTTPFTVYKDANLSFNNQNRLKSGRLVNQTMFWQYGNPTPITLEAGSILETFSDNNECSTTEYPYCGYAKTFTIALNNSQGFYVLGRSAPYFFPGGTVLYLKKIKDIKGFACPVESVHIPISGMWIDGKQYKDERIYFHEDGTITGQTNTSGLDGTTWLLKTKYTGFYSAIEEKDEFTLMANGKVASQHNGGGTWIRNGSIITITFTLSESVVKYKGNVYSNNMSGTWYSTRDAFKGTFTATKKE